MTVALKVTPVEKRAIEFVAGSKLTDVSNMLRDLILDPVMEEHARLTKKSAA